jgi:hypothetical protein
LPAQSLYPTIQTLYSLFKAAGVCKIIWYCCKLAFTKDHLIIPVLNTRGGAAADHPILQLHHEVEALELPAGLGTTLMDVATTIWKV